MRYSAAVQFGAKLVSPEHGEVDLYDAIFQHTGEDLNEVVEEARLLAAYEFTDTLALFPEAQIQISGMRLSIEFLP